MALKIPLVIGSDGLPQQLQSGDQLVVAQATADTRTLLNGEASTALVIGMAVYISASGTVKRGQANTKTTSGVVGVVYDTSISAAASGAVCVDGVVSTTTANWDAVAGTTGGLVAGATYFLDPANPGKITATPPTTVGQVVVPIGRALSSTDFEVNVGQPILL